MTARTRRELDIRQGDALEVLRTLPSDHFHCVVCSPPYWGLRMYLRDGEPGKEHEIGLEDTPEAWCARLVEVFREVRRVLRPDGTLWLNCGDSFTSSWGNQGRKEERGTQRPINGDMISQVHDGRYPSKGSNTGKIPDGSGLKPKDLVGQPWMLAFALRADGWWLRSEIIWAKPNPMPESVRDRCTKSHEQVFMLTKSATYFYDAEAVREANTEGSLARHAGPQEARHSDARINGEILGQRPHQGRIGINGGEGAGRNMRSVWMIATEPLPSIEVDGEKLDHFASYPTELARRCIRAGTSQKGCCPACGAPWARVVEREGGDYYSTGKSAAKHEQGLRTALSGYGPGGGPPTVTTTGWRPTCSCVHPADVWTIPCRVLDPFFGSGRTGLACDELGRDCTGIELNPGSVKMATAQIERARARRMIGDGERVPVLPGQLGLGL